jgi:hypothetical protein
MIFLSSFNPQLSRRFLILFMNRLVSSLLECLVTLTFRLDNLSKQRLFLKGNDLGLLKDLNSDFALRTYLNDGLN